MAETEHGLVHSGIHFVFDPEEKAFINQSQKDSVVQYSHNSERFTFSFPRYVRGHDMSLCNVAEIHYNNKRARSRDEQKGVVPIADLHIDAAAPDTVSFSWLLSGNATKFAGMLAFIAVLKCTDPSTGELFYALPTKTYCRLRVRGSMDNGEEMEAEYADLLEGWKAEVMSSWRAVADAAEQAKTLASESAADAAASREASKASAFAAEGHASAAEAYCTAAEEHAALVAEKVSDLDGFKGEKGDKGDPPVRGVDYWTEADKAEIKAYVDEAILGGAW